MFYVVDHYEQTRLIGTAETYRAALDIENEHLEKTDGECETEIYDSEQNANLLRAWGFL